MEKYSFTCFHETVDFDINRLLLFTVFYIVYRSALLYRRTAYAFLREKWNCISLKKQAGFIENTFFDD